ncbi:hypothetical protein JY651_26630 [Pyxidicoccus parkwayensis]|uniref:Lipoprotein n=1 Tax=Pyxidicoccus parkwayensis TaxID=2813578 RepID=A0ABX7NNE9_9BACT|nr:hypothetical protein [Pyxidicoccus parkwaysis]QSQ18931.1 hypothetical protein JY651_26630 [Pyxidicoccus parkwaysis]
MFVSRRSNWSNAGTVLALALALAFTGCKGDDDDEDDPKCEGGTGSPTTVSGKVTYDFVPATYSTTTKGGTLAFAQASERPVRSAVVQVRQGSNVLATGSTDEQGNYQLNYTPSTCGTVTVVALAKTTNPPIQVEDNTDKDAIWAIGDTITATTTTKNLHATHGWTGTTYTASQRTAAPFAILDSMYTASKAFMAVRTVTFPPLKVNWSPNNVPQSGDKATGQISTSHYSFQENEIYILGRVGVDTDEYDSHVIVHEWGHYFESNLSRADSPGGPHSTGDVLDPRLAFGEGYGNGLAAMLLPESMYVDTLWGSTTSGPPLAFGFDAETPPTPTDDPSPSVFSESSVMRILYDLYDSGANEGYDTVALGLGPIYDVLVGPQKTTEGMTTLGSFITGLKSQAGVNASAVDALLAHYNVGAITSPYGDGDTQLRAMYVAVPNTYPYNNNITLRGGEEANKQQQNRYFAFSGTGRTMNISVSNATYDVDIEVYKRGELVASSYKETPGTESVSLPTQSDTPYVLVVTGYSTVNTNYTVSVSITSP